MRDDSAPEVPWPIIWLVFTDAYSNINPWHTQIFSFLRLQEANYCLMWAIRLRYSQTPLLDCAFARKVGPDDSRNPFQPGILRFIFLHYGIESNTQDIEKHLHFKPTKIGVSPPVKPPLAHMHRTRTCWGTAPGERAELHFVQRFTSSSLYILSQQNTVGLCGCLASWMGCLRGTRRTNTRQRNTVYNRMTYRHICLFPLLNLTSTYLVS